MNDDQRTVWDLLTLCLWSIFFAIGLVPELAFYALRELGGVIAYKALVNSSAIITVGFTAYLALFAARQCRSAGLGPIASQGKALQIAVLGLLAFLEIPAKGSAFEARTLLEIVYAYDQLPGRYLQNVVLFVGLSKTLAWLYLYSLIVRFHAFGHRRVFATIPSLLPSVRVAEKDENASQDAAPPEIDEQPSRSEQG